MRGWRSATHLIEDMACGLTYERNMGLYGKVQYLHMHLRYGTGVQV